MRYSLDTVNDVFQRGSHALPDQWRFLVLGVFLWSITTFCNAQTHALTGWEFAPQRSDEWSGEIPETGWQPIKVPATLADQGFISIDHGFYRAPVLSKQLQALDEPAILLGSVLEADRSYFNGELVGAHGHFGPGLDTIAVYRKQRLYRIPKSLIRSNENTIHVELRVWNTYGGIVGPDPVIGEFQELAEISYQREYRHSMIDVAVFVLSGCALLVTIWLYFTANPRSSELIWLSVVMLSLFIINGIENLPAYNVGLKTGPLQVLAFLLTCTIAIPIAHYYHRLQLAVRSSWHLWRDIAIILSGVIYVLSVVSLLPLEIRIWAGSLWLIGITILLFELFMGSLHAAKYQIEGALLHFFALLSLVVFSIVLSGLYPSSLNQYRPDQIGISMFVLLIMLGYLKRNSALHKRHRELTSQVFALRNDEQQRISRDLHDGFGQQLATLKLQLNMLADTVDHDLVEQAQKSLNHGLKQLKEIALGLNPVSVDQHGLAWGIENEIASLTGLHQIEISLDLQKTSLDANSKLHFFRIFQESLNNAIKHSRADRLEVRLLQAKRSVVMEIKDNGIGYDASSLRDKRKSLGLINLRERAELIGARLSIMSSREKGTLIEVKMKLP